MLLLVGLIVIIACTKSLCASDSCREEMARLWEQEKLLKGQLQKQELLLHRLLHQPGNKDKVSINQTQDTRHTGQGHGLEDITLQLNCTDLVSVLTLQKQEPDNVLNTECVYTVYICIYVFACGFVCVFACVSDCFDLFSSGSKSSGLYKIKPNGSPSSCKVYCDMSDGGGWTIVQRRINGTETFNRSWAEYKDGFGDAHAEFWLGNENLHYITAHGNYSLRINLEDFDGNQRYAEYKNFKVADEKDHYRLTFGAYAGTAGDALSGRYQVGVPEWASHQGIKFSTYDQDNDNYIGNCAQEDKGGWWFNKCHSAHLNGMYYPNGHYSASTDNGVVWFPWKGWWYSLKTSIMKLRPTNFKTDLIDDHNVVHLSPSP
ncbi:fibrinogen-like protein 1 isoform X1 [Brachyistius frenatus]|uniref:fibrinogen-like protein 1 isoform X1 n=1 Tax=Brachyistius frenatus TaxID=100188 RepID=UPI0037E9650A